MKNKNLSIHVTENYLSKILGIPEEAIMELTRKGIFKPNSQGNYDPNECQELYSKYRTGQIKA